MRRAIVIAAAALAACGQQGSEAPATANGADSAGPQTYFAAEIAPVLEKQCASCHQTGTESGNISLLPANAAAQLVNAASVEAPDLMRVVPGKPDDSYLIMKLEGTHVPRGGNGAQMPFGAAPLPQATIDKFRKWIAEGAKP
jgi:hypothetical protein